MNAFELTTTVNTLANAIACRVSSEDLPLVAAVLTQLGDTLATIALTNEICQENSHGK